MKPHDVLGEAARTLEQRGQVYGEGWWKFGDVMDALFPEGLRMETAQDWVEYGALHQIVAKLCRFSSSGCRHIDSIHDLINYAAILESVLRAQEQPNAQAATPEAKEDQPAQLSLPLDDD